MRRARLLLLSLTSFAALCASSSFVSEAHAQSCPARSSWPGAAGFPRRTDETARLFPERVKALEDYMFTLQGDDEDRIGIRTDAMLVLHQGAVFYERYARGYEHDTPHLAWSVTKTITQLLTGVAVAQGAVKIEDSICAHLQNSPIPDGRCAITIQNLLEFSSGFDWREDYEGGKSRQDSSVIAMLYGQGKQDMAGFVLEQDLADPPGVAYRYSTGDSTLLLSTIDGAMRPRFGQDYPWTVLFDPLGIKDMTIEQDQAHHYVGGAYSFAPPEEWARIGFFLLNDGCWNDARILPEGWVAAATTPSGPFKNKRYDDLPDEEQGRQLWLNRPIPGVRDQKPWPNVPDDAYSAIGHWGQFIAVIPSRDIVIIRSGDDRDEKSLSIDRFLSLAIALTGDQ